MEIIELEEKKIFRAAKGKKVKFVNDESRYSEIVVDLDNKREIVEVSE